MSKTAKKQYSGAEMKRYLGSLKEHFTDGVKAVGEKVDYEEFTKLERRVGLLESRAGRRNVLNS